jgi:hypothetical protein
MRIHRVNCELFLSDAALITCQRYDLNIPEIAVEAVMDQIKTMQEIDSLAQKVNGSVIAQKLQSDLEIAYRRISALEDRHNQPYFEQGSEVVPSVWRLAQDPRVQPDNQPEGFPARIRLEAK